MKPDRRKRPRETSTTAIFLRVWPRTPSVKELTPLAEEWEKQKASSLLGPFTPMRRVHVDLDFGFCVYPAILNPAARKVERMNTIVIDNGQVHPPFGRH